MLLCEGLAAGSLGVDPSTELPEMFFVSGEPPRSGDTAPRPSDVIVHVQRDISASKEDLETDVKDFSTLVAQGAPLTAHLFVPLCIVNSTKHDLSVAVVSRLLTSSEVRKAAKSVPQAGGSDPAAAALPPEGTVIDPNSIQQLNANRSLFGRQYMENVAAVPALSRGLVSYTLPLDVAGRKVVGL